MTVTFPVSTCLPAVRKRQAHVLARLAVDRYTQAEQVRSSGTYVVTLQPANQPPEATFG